MGEISLFGGFDLPRKSAAVLHPEDVCVDDIEGDLQDNMHEKQFLCYLSIRTLVKIKYY